MASITKSLPESLYSREQVVKAEYQTVADGRISLFGLVEKAAESALTLLSQQQKLAQRMLLIAGNGNNGADTFVLGQKLLQKGVKFALLSKDSHNQTQELIQAKDSFKKAGGQYLPLSIKNLTQELDVSSIIVDGLLGTGFHGELRQSAIELFDIINQAKERLWILSLDIASGINANTGKANPIAIEADVTLCFGALKQGLFTSDARHYCGDIYFADIGLTSFCPSANVIKKDSRYLTDFFKPRNRNSHKGHFGRLIAVGGDLGMSGAIRLCAEAALRVGCGLVSVISHPQNQLAITLGRPELMFTATDGSQQIPENVIERINWASVLVLGPGLGQSKWSALLFSHVIHLDKPIVLDADGLNLLSQHPTKKHNWVLTPHPREAARLLNTNTEQIESDRFTAIKKLQQKYGGVVLLKGAGTLIYDGKQLFVAPVGNPGLSSGGCGDLLAGIIAGLIAQGMPLNNATLAGVILHGTAAELSAKDSGERGMLASDLMPLIRRLVN